MRNRSNLIRGESFRDTRLIVIATEGKDTERIYFKALANEYMNPRVHVHMLERGIDEKNNSSPEHVLNQLNDFKKKYELETDDELWVVIDRDSWTARMLSGVALECSKDDNMRMALSNPCIELWLLLHLVDPAPLTQEELQQWFNNKKKSKNADPYLKVRLRKELGSYHESRYDVERLIKNVEIAIKRARLLDKEPGDRWPQTLGTRVHLLAESIMKRNL